MPYLRESVVIVWSAVADLVIGESSRRNHPSLFLTSTSDFFGLKWEDSTPPSSCCGASELSGKTEVFKVLFLNNVSQEPPLSEFSGVKWQTLLSHSLEDGFVCLVGSPGHSVIKPHLYCLSWHWASKLQTHIKESTTRFKLIDRLRWLRVFWSLLKPSFAGLMRQRISFRSLYPLLSVIQGWNFRRARILHLHIWGCIMALVLFSRRQGIWSFWC